MIDRRIADDACRLVAGDRQKTYGHPVDNMYRLALLWGGYLGIHLTAGDASRMMMLLKVIRSKGEYHRDNYVDAVGYLLISEACDGDQ